MYAGGEGLDSLGWYNQNAEDNIHSVGTRAPNGYGLYDMSGNAFEWCLDYYAGDYYSKSAGMKDPVNNTESGNVVTRGGGWGGVPSSCRVANRGHNLPSYIVGSNGGRLVVVP